MSYRIIVDSCCDLTAEQAADPRFVRVPLTILLDGETFVDDASLDQSRLLWQMKHSPNAPSTACPSPQQYLEAMDCGADDVYVVCLSAMLSGSHNSAAQGRALLLDLRLGLEAILFDALRHIDDDLSFPDIGPHLHGGLPCKYGRNCQDQQVHAAAGLLRIRGELHGLRDHSSRQIFMPVCFRESRYLLLKGGPEGHLMAAFCQMDGKGGPPGTGA